MNSASNPNDQDGDPAENDRDDRSLHEDSSFELDASEEVALEDDDATDNWDMSAALGELGGLGQSDASQEDELSLDDLGAAYARVAAEQDPELATEAEEEPDEANEDDSLESEESDDEAAPVVTPEAIVEAALFVGHPENKPLSEQRIASLMRGVTPDEVIELIDRLNESYIAEGQALRVIREESGFRMTIAPAVEHMRRSFLGKVREARLSQTAIEVLSLVAYQPGITTQKVEDQRGRESGSLLNQLVRRQLLRIERVKPSDGGRAVPHYYPTERFLHLFSLESLDDLPQVEEGLRE